MRALAFGLLISLTTGCDSEVTPTGQGGRGGSSTGAGGTVNSGGSGGSLTQCPAIGCDPLCGPGGVKLDEHGCPTCTCAEEGGASAGALKWYTTCGAPVCGMEGGGGTQPASTCGTLTEGQACATENQTCDLGDGCSTKLICATSDPKEMQGGCPISRERHKRDIRYLSASEADAIHDRLLEMPLATYSYKSEPESAKRHLGFIIDNDPSSPAVLPNGERVDMYGFVTMTAAAIQAQARHIEELEREVGELRRTREDCRANDAR